MKKTVLIGGLVVGIGAVTIGVVAGQGSVDKPKDDVAATPKTSSGLVEFRDSETGFALQYPKTWSILPSKDRDISAVIVEPAPAENQGGSILARVTDLEVEITADQVEQARPLTDAVINSGAGVQLITDPTTVEVGGLPGLVYAYTFADSASGQRGAHSHYFLFKGRTMISLVFQGVPEADFVRLASTFDQVANSFRVLKN